MDDDDEKTFTGDENGLRLCKECERTVDDEGCSTIICGYGSDECPTCGGCFCDQSC